MLDQNTDRMWFVIGALVVGAGIILLVNQFMPGVFAQVGKAFNGVTKDSVNTIKDAFHIDNIISASDLRTFGGPKDPQEVKLIDFDEETETWTLELPVNKVIWSRGLRVIETAIRVPYGARFTTRYEVWVPEGIDNAFVNTDINNAFESKPFESSQNDNDERAARQFGYYENGKRVVMDKGKNTSVNIPIKGGEWTTVWYSYSNTSSTNTNKEALRDYSWIGTTNPTDGPMVIKIRNVYGSIVDEKGNFRDKNGEVIE